LFCLTKKKKLKSVESESTHYGHPGRARLFLELEQTNKKNLFLFFFNLRPFAKSGCVEGDLPTRPVSGRVVVVEGD
jgi:hypothetical protein